MGPFLGTLVLSPPCCPWWSPSFQPLLETAHSQNPSGPWEREGEWFVLGASCSPLQLRHTARQRVTCVVTWQWPFNVWSPSPAFSAAAGTGRGSRTARAVTSRGMQGKAAETLGLGRAGPLRGSEFYGEEGAGERGVAGPAAAPRGTGGKMGLLGQPRPRDVSVGAAAPPPPPPRGRGGAAKAKGKEAKRRAGGGAEPQAGRAAPVPGPPHGQGFSRCHGPTPPPFCRQRRGDGCGGGEGPRPRDLRDWRGGLRAAWLRTSPAFRTPSSGSPAPAAWRTAYRR